MLVAALGFPARNVDRVDRSLLAEPRALALVGQGSALVQAGVERTHPAHLASAAVLYAVNAGVGGLRGWLKLHDALREARSHGPASTRSDQPRGHWPCLTEGAQLAVLAPGVVLEVGLGTARQYQPLA